MEEEQDYNKNTDIRDLNCSEYVLCAVNYILAHANFAYFIIKCPNLQMAEYLKNMVADSIIFDKTAIFFDADKLTINERRFRRRVFDVIDDIVESGGYLRHCLHIMTKYILNKRVETVNVYKYTFPKSVYKIEIVRCLLEFVGFFQPWYKYDLNTIEDYFVYYIEPFCLKSFDESDKKKILAITSKNAVFKYKPGSKDYNKMFNGDGMQMFCRYQPDEKMIELLIYKRPLTLRQVKFPQHVMLSGDFQFALSRLGSDSRPTIDAADVRQGMQEEESFCDLQISSSFGKRTFSACVGSKSTDENQRKTKTGDERLGQGGGYSFQTASTSSTDENQRKMQTGDERLAQGGYSFQTASTSSTNENQRKMQTGDERLAQGGYSFQTASTSSSTDENQKETLTGDERLAQGGYSFQTASTDENQKETQTGDERLAHGGYSIQTASTSSSTDENQKKTQTDENQDKTSSTDENQKLMQTDENQKMKTDEKLTLSWAEEVESLDSHYFRDGNDFERYSNTRLNNEARLNEIEVMLSGCFRFDRKIRMSKVIREDGTIKFIIDTLYVEY